MADEVDAANDGVVRFHEMLDAGQFEAIYDQSAPEMKKAATKAETVAFLSAVHRKLGNVKAAAKQTWNVNYNTSGTFVTAVYNTTFSEGEGQEQFVFGVHGKAADLVGYHVNSNVFVLK